jgi:NAD(P)-dependent dehydrogenase (short-subunit alcohol dehydrogenase family)
VRTALITGGSGGIGKACGRKLVELGYDVVLTARREEPLRAAAEEMGARYVVADATEPEKFEPAVQAAGEIDLLVHASGILGGTYARKQTFEQWRATMSANLDSCFVVTSAALPRMKAGSRFVFISSSAAHEPMRARTAYSASKAGMNAFALALAQEVDRDGINVHIVTPGPVETDMPTDVAEAVAWLDTVDPSVDLPEIRLHAITRGPAAREPVVPIEVERRAAKS